ncbi:MAG: hypothetical protein GX808_12340 [Syntrophomonadaceae bacterium]|nr:hypothetical protein [Syntrophomonadaceae bacterium]
MFACKDNFCIGINYWPIKKAMYWWRNFERTEVEQDFTTLASNKFKLVRIFLTWEDFQPQPDLVSKIALENLLWTADCAERNSLQLIPTFFCGHMSGVNWLPYWMIEDKNDNHSRFRIFCQTSYKTGKIKNYYADNELILAQCEQITAVVKMLCDHPGVHSYDLGNEASNLAIPESRKQGRNWLDKMVSAVKNITPAPVTFGMHAEDLEEDRNLWPQDAAEFCDYLCMHAYPFYLSWLKDPFDYMIVPFLTIITEWLSQKPVFMQEFGLPTLPVIHPLLPENDRFKMKSPLWDEKQAALYYEKTLTALCQQKVPAALSWCFADYSPYFWDLPPLKENHHERYFGLFRHDGSPKEAVGVIKEGTWQKDSPGINNGQDFLLDIQRDNFYRDPRKNLADMFAAYKAGLKAGVS